ncbi:MAG: hypothetical protein ACFFD8_03455 [Candidatus Thorarchaeota archaeon]
MKSNSLMDNCKPRTSDFFKEKTNELNGSLDELLDSTPLQRKMSYHQALHMIKQFTYIMKDYNYLINSKN